MEGRLGAGGVLHAPTSDVPTLIFEGAFDPVLPPSLGDDIAKTLSHATIVVIPAGSHGNAIHTPCATSITAAFLDDPSAQLDTSVRSRSLPQPFAVDSDVDLDAFNATEERPTSSP